MSSATNTLPPGAGAEGKIGGATPRPNPVALEVMVSVTGARAGANAASRDLFSEETTTVLVFKDGAVIRLAAAVNAGQLLFLTSKKNNQEVVCQVLHRKPISENSSYVELKFTEDRKDYWGVAFPQEAARAPEFRIAEQKQAEAMTAQAPEPAVEPHSAEDVDELKLEVEALRDQLEALQKNNVAEAAARAMAEASSARENAKRQATLREASKVVDELMGHDTVSSPVPPHASPAEQPPQKEKPELLMPAAPKDANEVARAVVNMSLPVWKMELSPEEQLLEEEKAHELANAPVKKPAPVVEEGSEERSAEIEAADASLPKPALDFSNVPTDAKKSVRGTSVPTFGGTVKVKTIGLVAVLMLALVGGAWYGKVWTLLPFGKKAASASSVNANRPVIRSAPKTATSAPSATPAGTQAAAGTDAALKDATKPSDTPSATDTAKNAVAADGNSGTATPPAEEPMRKSGKGKQRGTEPEASNTSAANSAEAVPADAPAVAAKLLRQVNPVYPPDAMRSYITGDVKAEVTVGPNGRVSKVNVISGPKALRDAAVEALKQYEYAPATQGGKSVESKTTEVVKFWFNP